MGGKWVGGYAQPPTHKPKSRRLGSFCQPKHLSKPALPSYARNYLLRISGVFFLLIRP